MVKNKIQTTKKAQIFKIIAIALASILCIGAIAGGMGILKVDKDTAADKLLPSVHPDNMYANVDLALESMNDGQGVTVEVTERTGAITLDGKAEDDLTYVIGTVELDEGTYTITALEGASKNTVYVTATVGDVDTNFDFTGNELEIMSDNTAVTLTIHIKVGTELNNVKVLPVIADAELEDVSFYK